MCRQGSRGARPPTRNRLENYLKRREFGRKLGRQGMALSDGAQGVRWRRPGRRPCDRPRRGSRPARALAAAILQQRRHAGCPDHPGLGHRGAAASPAATDLPGRGAGVATAVGARRRLRPGGREDARAPRRRPVRAQRPEGLYRQRQRHRLDVDPRGHRSQRRAPPEPELVHGRREPARHHDPADGPARRR